MGPGAACKPRNRGEVANRASIETDKHASQEGRRRIPLDSSRNTEHHERFKEQIIGESISLAT